MTSEAPPPDNTPDSPFGPAMNLAATVAAFAAYSGPVRQVATDFGVDGWLPYAIVAVGLYSGLCWYYRRAVGRGRRWALKLRDVLP